MTSFSFNVFSGCSENSLLTTHNRIFAACVHLLLDLDTIKSPVSTRVERRELLVYLRTLSNVSPRCVRLFLLALERDLVHPFFLEGVRICQFDFCLLLVIIYSEP